MIYSVVPTDIIFAGADQEMGALKEIKYLGYNVQVTPLSNSTYVIQRILSTDPLHFLDERLQPGTIIGD